MARLDFENTRYARFFADKSNQNFLQTFIDKSGLLNVNYGWWKTQCKKDSTPTPTDNDGTASFTQKSRKLDIAPMMDLRAPLGKGLQEDVEGIECYSATIPHFISPAFVETAPERMVRIKQFEEFGNDADLVAMWVKNLQEKIDSGHQTLNWMTAQLMTLGYINYNKGRGIKMPLHQARIPQENFKTAGATVWTSDSINLLSVMAEKELQYRETFGYDGELTWQMTKAFYQGTFLKNKEIKEAVASWRKANYISDTENLPVAEADWLKTYADYVDNISPIQLVVETEKNYTDGGSEVIHGWDDKYVVLRPAGKPCDLKWTTPLDQSAFRDGMVASTVKKIFARANDGVSTIINTTNDNGEYKEWRTEVVMSATPALNEFTNHVIFDTSTTD